MDTSEPQKETTMSDKTLIDRVQKLKAVFILGGDIIPAKDPNHLGLGWRSLCGTEKDKTGAMPSYERVQAGASLWRMNPDIILIPSGGESNLPEQTGKSPAISTVMAAELQALEVPAQNIIEEDKSFTTRDHFTYCPQIAKAHGWAPHEIGILTVFFHLGRVSAGLVAIGKDAEPLKLGEVALLSAERVLAAEDDAWDKVFVDLYSSPEMVTTLVGEALGTGQLLAGHQPKYPRPFTGFPDPLA